MPAPVASCRSIFRALLVLAPLVLGRGTLNKYVVAAGFLCACAGLSLLINGLLDRFLGSR